MLNAKAELDEILGSKDAIEPRAARILIKTYGLDVARDVFWSLRRDIRSPPFVLDNGVEDHYHGTRDYLLAKFGSGAFQALFLLCLETEGYRGISFQIREFYREIEEPNQHIPHGKIAPYPRRMTPKQLQRIEAIEQAKKDGASSVAEIATRLGISRGSVYHYGYIGGINLPGTTNRYRF